MLNLVAFDNEYDSELLAASYESLRQKECLQIVTDKKEQHDALRMITSALSVPHESAFSFQNLFKITSANGEFYIAQCLLDYGYPVSAKLSQSSVHKYHFQVVGFAALSIDLGKTLLRRESRTDKLLGNFFGNDIDVEGAEKFNDKYYLVSTDRQNIIKAFDHSFTGTLSKYDNIVLKTEENKMFITFESEMEENHSRIIEEIFGSFRYLLTHMTPGG